MALQADRALGAGAARRGARARRRQPAAGGRAREAARSRSTRRRSTRTCFSPSEATDAGKHDEAREVAREGARDQPVEPRGARAARRRSPTSRTSRRSSRRRSPRCWPSRRTTARSTAIAGELAAHNYRFDEAVDADAARARARRRATRATLADLGVHLLRTGDEPAARAALEPPSSSIPFDVVTFNLLQMMDTLDKFVTVRDGDVVLRHAQGRGAGAAGVRAAARAAGARARSSSAVRVHAAGPDPHRDLPEARRLRGAQRRPARHDRRARRLLRPRRDDGFAEGAAAGRVPVGGDALARAGARRHAADVEPAGAAVADRRHLGLRGEAGAARVGAARWTCEFAGDAQSRRDAEAARPERGVHRIRRRSRSRTSRRRCSSSTSSTTFGDAGLHKLLRAYGAGARHRRGAEVGADTDFDQLQVGFDQIARAARSATLRAALAPPDEDVELPKMPLEALRTLRGAEPAAAIRCRWRSAARCARREQLDEAMQAFERAAALVPIAARRRQPARADRRDRAREEGHGRARSPRCRRWWRSTSTTSRRRGSWRGCCAQSSVDRRRRRFSPVYRAHRRRSIRSTPRRTAMLGRLALQRNDADAATREFRDGRSRSGRSIARPRTPISPRAISRAASAPRRRSRRSRRSRSRRATSARRTCC